MQKKNEKSVCKCLQPKLLIKLIPTLLKYNAPLTIVVVFHPKANGNNEYIKHFTLTLTTSNLRAASNFACVRSTFWISALFSFSAKLLYFTTQHYHLMDLYNSCKREGTHITLQK